MGCACIIGQKGLRGCAYSTFEGMAADIRPPCILRFHHSTTATRKVCSYYYVERCESSDECVPISLQWHSLGTVLVRNPVPVKPFDRPMVDEEPRCDTHHSARLFKLSHSTTLSPGNIISRVSSGAMWWSLLLLWPMRASSAFALCCEPSLQLPPSRTCVNLTRETSFVYFCHSCCSRNPMFIFVSVSADSGIICLYALLC